MMSLTEPTAERSLATFFNPRSVAIIGASSKLSSISGQYLRYLRDYGYSGDVFPVNPRHQEIAQLPCYPSVRDVPAPVDVAIVVVPSRFVLPAVQDCASADVPFVVVPSAGFGEAGTEGAGLERELVATAREAGIRILGPNCMGFVNFKDKVVGSFGAFLAQGAELRSGNVGLVTQSGAFGAKTIRSAGLRNVGFTYEVSTGNEADLGALDFMEFMLDDPDTKVVAAFIEGVKGAQRLIDIGHKAAVLGKPIVVLKAGKSSIGARAVQSHTGRISSPARIYEGIFEQAGLVEVSTATEFVDAIETFSRLAVEPRGKSVGVIVGSGGNGILLSDNADSLGLHMPELASDTQEKIRDKIPEAGSLVNPVDVTAQIAHNAENGMVPVVEAVFEDPGIDMVVVGTNQLAIRQCWKQFIELAERSRKPLGVIVSSDVPDEIIEAFRRTDVVLPDDDGYSLLRKLRLLHLKAARSEHIRAAVAEPGWGLATYEIEQPPGALSEADAKALLRSVLPIPAGEVVKSPLEAAGAAEGCGYPVVAKLVSPALQHKSEIGALRLHLRSQEEVRAAYDELMLQAQQHEVPNAEVLVESMAPEGVEVVLGFLRDPALGPVLAFGAGGVLVELVKDGAYRAAPITASEAQDMIEETLAGQLLRGFRGAPAKDVDAVVRLIVEASRVFVANPWMRELEFNPITVLPVGKGAVVLDVLLTSQ